MTYIHARQPASQLKSIQTGVESIETQELPPERSYHSPNTSIDECHHETRFEYIRKIHITSCNKNTSSGSIHYDGKCDSSILMHHRTSNEHLIMQDPSTLSFKNISIHPHFIQQESLKMLNNQVLHP